MQKILLAVVFGSLVAIGVTAAKAATKYTCTLTNKTVEKCCCIRQKDGALYCTLAKKTVDPCCCVEAKSR